jgi:hypothetical protein
MGDGAWSGPMGTVDRDGAFKDIDFTKKSMATDVPMLKPIQVFSRYNVQ